MTPPRSASAPASAPAAAGPPAGVTVRYWAGARAAAGRDTDRLLLPGAKTVGDALEQVATVHPALGPVLAVASILVDGRVAGAADALADGSTLEVLPPFAGG